jgi:hypothetical protein
MIDPFWALAVIFLVIIVIFVVLPDLIGGGSAVKVRQVPTQAQAHAHAQQPAVEYEDERCMDREMLKSFYPPPLLEETPVDYPRKAIGACPVSKPQSRGLPAVDIPMYAI